MANGWGGTREGAGRKRKIITDSRSVAEKKHLEDAGYALALVVEWMRDKKLKNLFRFSYAQVVMDRVWGKPQQRVEQELRGVIDLTWPDGTEIPGVT